MTVVVLCIRSNRFDLLAGLVLFYLAAASLAWWRVRRNLKRWAPFSGTLAELKKDEACLDGKN